MGLHDLYDGEFWMEFYGDFCREFEEVSICTLGPDFNHDGTVDEAEAVKVIFGEWVAGEGFSGILTLKNIIYYIFFPNICNFLYFPLPLNMLFAIYNYPTNIAEVSTR